MNPHLPLLGWLGWAQFILLGLKVLGVPWSLWWILAATWFGLIYLGICVAWIEWDLWMMRRKG